MAWQIVVGTGISILTGLFGNLIYMDKALREVRKTLQKYPQEADRTRKLRKLGGTSFWFVIVFLLAVLLLDLAF